MDDTSRREAIDLESLMLAAQLADVKEVEYRNTLALASLIELLVEKGVLFKGEMAAKALQLDEAAEAEIRAQSGLL